MSTQLVKLQDVTFSYHGSPVLESIDMEINKGDYVGVIGPNGGGKTTLLKLIIGLLHPDKGKISLFGAPIKSFTQWPRIGYVAQRATTMDMRLPMTVEEVVSLGRIGRIGLFHFAEQKDKRAIHDAMEKVGIVDLRKQLITELSGGQQQRVFIAKAMAAHPDILILDEPTVGIDVASQDAFYQLLAHLNKNEDLTLVMVSHDIDVVVNEVNKIACINKTLMYHGAPQAFVKGDYMARLYGKERRFILHDH